MKLLTPEDLDISEEMEAAWSRSRREQMIATIKTLAERLAQVEECQTCSGVGRVDVDEVHEADCPDCDGTGLAHKDAMAALWALGEER